MTFWVLFAVVLLVMFCLTVMVSVHVSRTKETRLGVLRYVYAIHFCALILLPVFGCLLSSCSVPFFYLGRCVLNMCCSSRKIYFVFHYLPPS
jgi:hypothetical protein